MFIKRLMTNKQFEAVLKIKLSQNKKTSVS